MASLAIHGLADVMQGEMIELPGGRYALALNLNRICWCSCGRARMLTYRKAHESYRYWSYS